MEMRAILQGAVASSIATTLEFPIEFYRSLPGEAGMAITRKQVETYVLGYFRQDFTNPKKTDNLRTDLGFNDQGLRLIARENFYNWNGAKFTPAEFLECKTIGDIIDLLCKKLGINGAPTGAKKAKKAKKIPS
jgi:hypothetical protein